MTAMPLPLGAKAGHAPCAHANYSLTCEEYEALRARAGEQCEICLMPESETSHGLLHIDHDETRGTWAVRGLLCSRCNSTLRPNSPTSAAVIAYLAAPWRVSPPQAGRRLITTRYARRLPGRHRPASGHVTATQAAPATSDEILRRLSELGAQRTAVMRRLEATNKDLDVEILYYAGTGMQQSEIVRRTGLTRESAAQKMRPAGKSRWKRGTTS